MRKGFCLPLICLGVSFIMILSASAQSFQVRGAGGSLSIMQSGNPGSSASFAVSSRLKIEPNERIVKTGIPAPFPIAVAIPRSAGGSAKKNHIVEVCSLETDKCFSVFPTGSDVDYQTYQSCLGEAGSVALDCAESWAISKGYLPYEQYLTLKAIDPVLVEVEEFKATAPKEFLQPEVTVKVEEKEVPVFELKDKLKTNLVFDLETGRTNVTVPESASETLKFDLESGTVVEELTRSAAPEEFAEEVTDVVGEDLETTEVILPREPDPAVEREHYTCLKVPGFVAHNDVWRWLAYRLLFVLTMLVIIIFLLGLWVFLIWNRLHKKKTENSGLSVMNRIKKWFVVFLLIFSSWTGLGQAQVTTTPQLLIYEGELLDGTGNPLPGDFTFRFSFWLNPDFENADLAVGGGINTAAIDFLGWEETQTETLDDQGRFSFQLGTVTPFTPDVFDQDDLYLQVEVRNAGDPDTAYEVIDIDADDATVDRKIIASVPFAFNANKLDFRDTGVRPGDIPFLDDVTGLLPESILPDVSSSGSNGNIFTIDRDGNAGATETLVLQFGDTIAESLAWNGLTNQFEFSESVNIAGDLTVTGTVNGVRIGPSSVSDRLSPRYPNSIFEMDGTANSGEMHEEQEVVFGGAERQVLRWTTDLLSQQSYDILVRYTLPENFSNWEGPAINLDYIAPSNVGNAHIDLRVFQDGSTVDQLSGTGLDLSSNAWINKAFNLNAATVWSPGDVVQIELKMHSRSSIDPRVADILLNYVVK